MENYSLSDLKAITDGADGISGGSAWLIILFILIFGNGGFGWGNRANAGAEYASTNEILSGQKFDALSRQINQVGDGLASSTYALNNAIKDGNAAVTGAIVSESRTTQNMISSYACENQKNVDNLRFDMSNYAAQINSNIDNKFAALEKSQLEQRLEAQAQMINQLQIQQAVCGIPKVNTAGWGTYPYSCGGCGCGNV